MRLIDADKFEVVSFTQESEDFTRGVEYMVDKIDNTPTVNAIAIPDNATNGDMIKALFDCKIVEETHSTYTVNISKDYFWKNL